MAVRAPPASAFRGAMRSATGWRQRCWWVSPWRVRLCRKVEAWGNRRPRRHFGDVSGLPLGPSSMFRAPLVGTSGMPTGALT